MDFDSGAGLLHRLTSYNPNREWDVRADDPRLRHDLPQNDPDRLPPPVKEYEVDLPVTKLPRDLPRAGASAAAVLAGAPQVAQELDAAQLGRVLFLGGGIVRTSERAGRRTLFRAAGSAGARFPLEIYVSTRDVRGVPDGVHWYDPIEHTLRQVGPPAGGQATTIVVTGIPWRTGWRYAERGWRHLYWDAGTLLSQLLAAAASAGLEPRLRTLFPDAQLRDLVAADGVHEYPLALVSLADGEPAIEPSGPAVKGALPSVELPLCTEAQRAGERDQLGPPWPQGEALDEVPESPSLDEVIMRRGSQRLMDRKATLPRELLEWPMRAALRGIEVPHWVVVHGVDGVAP
ncbi:MAG TPA: SagB/ThcOx family dehydrogenase, partial [Dehalococcoidia bacterium]|nr:SagB/ThcOx family dehydrogenase [Dehalococcoidia bacterium]